MDKTYIEMEKLKHSNAKEIITLKDISNQSTMRRKKEFMLIMYKLKNELNNNDHKNRLERMMLALKAQKKKNK